MFDPIFQINNKLLKCISQIEASKAIIESSPLLPLYERQFKSEAAVRKVHFSTAIEGNYLNLNEVRRIVDGDIREVLDDSGENFVARKRDVYEVINYRDLIKYIDNVIQDLKQSGQKLTISEENLKEMHKILLRNIYHSVGKYRVGTALSVNFATGEKLYPYEEVDNINKRIKDLISWYNSADANNINPILKAGILHLEFVRIHPFEEGNGRMARALATLSLSADGYDVGHFFCLDEYYDSNAQDYYFYLGDGFINLNSWLEYFCLGMAIEFNRIRERVQKISKDARIKQKVGRLYITERQEKIIEWLNNYGFFRNQDFAILFSELSDDTVLRELKVLVDNKIIAKKGKTKSARYELV
jgi:Fic family protein